MQSRRVLVGQGRSQGLKFDCRVMRVLSFPREETFVFPYCLIVVHWRCWSSTNEVRRLPAISPLVRRVHPTGTAEVSTLAQKQSIVMVCRNLGDQSICLPALPIDTRLCLCHPGRRAPALSVGELRHSKILGKADPLDNQMGEGNIRRPPQAQLKCSSQHFTALSAARRRLLPASGERLPDRLVCKLRFQLELPPCELAFPYVRDWLR